MGKTSFQRMARPFSASPGFTAGVLFSNRQAMLHPWQATHLSRSITMDQRVIAHLFEKETFGHAGYTFTRVLVKDASPESGSVAGLNRASPFTPRPFAQRPTAVW